MNRIALAIASVGLLGLALTPNLRADEWNKKTIITTNQPMQVPNKVLPAGKYVMKLLDSPSDRHIVQIYDANEQHLITTVLALPNYRIQPTGKTAITFWETPPGQPRALRAWFYPGDNFGQEFAYPKSAATQIAAYNKQNVPTTYAQSEENLTTARVGTVTPQGEEQPAPAPPVQTQIAQNTPPANTPATTPTPQATTAPAATPAPTQLPKTASPYPLVGLFGLLSLGLYGALRLVRA